MKKIFKRVYPFDIDEGQKYWIFLKITYIFPRRVPTNLHWSVKKRVLQVEFLNLR